MNEDKAKEIFNYLLKDHNLDKFLEFCTDDIKFILHPKHVIAGEYDRKCIYDLFAHLAKSFPNWSEAIDEVFHDQEKKVFIIIFGTVCNNIQSEFCCTESRLLQRKTRSFRHQH